MQATRVTALYGLRYPIIQGGMAWVSHAPLVAAVSEAGGLGLLGASTMTPDELRRNIHRARELTEKPFGVNFPIFNPNAAQYVRTILDEGVGIVFTSAGSPKKYTPTLHDAGVIVTHVVASPVHARKAADAGVDAVVCEGFEAGGHDSPDMLSTLCLVPLVRDAVPDLPVIAAGGIADPRQFAAVMALGADGIQMGTRFVAATENTAVEPYKQAIVDADEHGTIFAGRKAGPVRVLRNQWSERLLDAELRGADREELQHIMHNGDHARLGNIEGDMEEGSFDCGLGAALIHEVASCREIIEAFVAGYDATVETL